MEVFKQTKICFVSTIPNTLFFYLELLKTLKNLDANVVVLTSENPFLFDLQKKTGCAAYPIKISRSITLSGDLAAYRKIKKFFQKERIDLIHAHTPKAGLLSMLASYQAGIPVRLYTIHGLVLETAAGLKRRILRKCEQAACRNSTKVLSVSKSLRERILQEKICPADKIILLGDGSACGIDLNIYTLSDEVRKNAAEIRKRLSISAEAVVLGFVGRITPEKGISLLVRTFIELLKEKPDLHLLMVGRIDQEREKVDSSTYSIIHGHPRIHLAGHVPYPVEYYAAMDIFVMPSKREGFGMCNIEAAGMGLPVVASRITGCVDSVQDGRTGLLFDLDNPQDLLSSLRKLIDNLQARIRMGQNGMQWVQTYFSSDRMVQEHLCLYSKLLKREDLRK